MDSPVLEPPLLFISDVHLGAFSSDENRHIETDLIQLINFCQHNKIRIAILGDLFDYWMEYPDYVPKLGTELLHKFEKFNSLLGPTLYITGNHDNWTRQHFRERGFYLEHEQHTFSLDGRKIMALHGDGLVDSDFNMNRPLLHRILRNERFINIFQNILPPQMGLATMKYFSRLTRLLDLDTNKEQKLDSWAKKLLSDSDIDLILCGHDHIPRRKQFSFGTFINLGSFYKDRTMALYNNKCISLVCWEVSSQSIIQLEANRIE